MDTKFELNYIKSIYDSKWRYLVNIWFDDFGYLTTKTIRENLLKIMLDLYGKQDINWSIRWTSTGADIRFVNDCDAGSFIMFYTDTKDSDRWYRNNSSYVGGGH